MGPFCYLCFVSVFVMHSLFFVVLCSPAGRGWYLGSRVCGIFLCFVLLSHVVSLVRCGDWLYQFLIFILFFTLNNKLFV